MFGVQRTAEFSEWLDALTDSKARAAVITRLGRLALGNAGDVKPVGSGVSEMRIDIGPGYRAYYMRVDRQVLLMLGGGDKASQAQEIGRALKMAAALRAPANSGKRKTENEKMSRTLNAKVAKRLGIRRFDASEYLHGEADISAYLEAVLAEDDPRLLAAALGDVARARGMTQLARETGLSREALYRALSTDGNPELVTVTKVLRALGLRLSIQPVAA